MLRVAPAARARKLAKVPFVELADGRLQGVVSSGSDVERVYVSSVTAGSHAVNCSTNNNRPCGGLRGTALCTHLYQLAHEALRQYGVEQVARYLQVDVGDGEGISVGSQLLDRTDARHEPGPAAVVFSRFLRHLAYLEVPPSAAPVPELHWFPATAGVR
ncbi:hypothetical protein [Micromonospora sp. WMMD980]|uniref:hypothetical protein n=1 Tax=Micromonospora sp. WMMD980 TaxID=3016088 RepID=UPI002417DE04|nr:hypothetical protein [Micromonospora sp. WMMD980]MDG4800946.1 hypothetical protein [Micromonospora sp. WMMD980]